MNTLKTCGAVAALTLGAAAFAQTQDTPSTPTTPSSSQTQRTQGEGTAMPSTSQAEGTAADRSAPGNTPTRQMGAADTTTGTTASPQPSTSQTEGTAADSTPPGKTPTTGTASTSQQQGRELVGASVVGSNQSALGKVVDVVFDSKGQPEFVVVSTDQGKVAAIPYETATQMKSGNKVVIDQSRLQRAPTVKQGEWRGQSDTWKDDASRYWNEG